MRTKEEILDSNHINSDDGAMYTGLIKKSMQEYADQECIKFVDWILKQPKYKVKSNSNLELLNLYKEQHEK